MTDGLAQIADGDRRGQAKALAERVTDQVGRIILGKTDEIKLALACVLARGHLLIEDVPGVGKTLLARSLAIALGLDYRRIQFTSDMLPADIIGVSVFEQKTGQFRFHRGPLFAELVLADEVNRATPKSQSALLEAMEEQQVTADGETYDLPSPFFVIATQNPTTQIGTFPLPESQLDRFLMCIGLGYPPEQMERALLSGEDRRDLLHDLKPVLSSKTLVELQAAAKSVHVSEAILDYIQALVRFTRETPEIEFGLSPRGAVDLVAAARCWAMINGHAGVHPEDVKAIFVPVVGHRLQALSDGQHADPDVASFVLESVAVP
ncbi:MAG: AAA family ATPase [Gammaproteobacteria bacterium]|nr:AAA family ATPase [Gammaproteobacteria bacterium]MBT8443529.1 AAA family ATPase [Gammaproteobacteria bacterium]NND37645.1 AAA family ATPase [Gammaproteobacteria bacterium]